MWRAAGLAVALAAALCTATQATVFTEGGSSRLDSAPVYGNAALRDEYSSREDELAAQEELEQAIREYLLDEQRRLEEEEWERQAREAAGEEQPNVEQILKELIEQQQQEQLENTKNEEANEKPASKEEKPAAAEKAAAPAAPVAEQKEQPEEEPIANQQPLSAQKKGQNEFVSFVEPPEAKQTKAIPNLDKRRLVSSLDYAQGVPRYGSSLLLVAVGTVMTIGLVGTVIAGGVYIKRRRDTPDDSEYAPYAGTGPGAKRGIKAGDKGDENLAYKAQLHQYQQAKQKIICGDDAPGVMESDNEEVDDENNFSVYECPGLAPTGDIEVCNPNFAANR